MKKAFLWILVCVMAVCSCSCQTEWQAGQLLYDCGVTAADEVSEYSFVHKEYLLQQEKPQSKLVLTEQEDFSLLQYYTYVSDLPTERRHELYVYPYNGIIVTIGEREHRFVWCEDGSLLAVPDVVDGVAQHTGKIYQADEAHRITPDKFNAWITKYDG